MARQRPADPLAPFEFLIGFFLALTAALVLLIAGSLAFRWNEVSVVGMGDRAVCVTTSLSTYGLAPDPQDDIRVEGVARDVAIGADRARLCDQDPGLREQLLNGLTQLPSLLVFLGFVVLLRRIVKYARANGLFSHALATRLIVMGRFLIVGILVAAFLRWLAEGLLLSSMVDSQGWTSGDIHLSLPAVIGAVGVVSIGRIMLMAAELQADVDGTV